MVEILKNYIPQPSKDFLGKDDTKLRPGIIQVWIFLQLINNTMNKGKILEYHKFIRKSPMEGHTGRPIMRGKHEITKLPETHNGKT